jgi:hypothetical protein
MHVKKRAARSQLIRSLLITCAAAVAMVISSCSSKDLEDLAGKAKEGINQAKEKVSEAQKTVESTAKKLPGAVASITAGDIKLTLDAPLNASVCAARFTPPKDGRSGLFQIGTSVDSGPRSYPAVYLHAPTDAASLPALVGQTVQGQLFIAKSEASGHFQSPDEKPVSLQIVKVENGVVTCQLQSAELAGIDQPMTVPVSGSLVAGIVP